MSEFRTPLVDHITLNVSDLTASRRFYEAVYHGVSRRG
jgi:catechol 2,3-dioxygenase-like lactoylglutathione lyase family enzyme